MTTLVVALVNRFLLGHRIPISATLMFGMITLGMTAAVRWYWRLHVERNGRVLIEWTRGRTFDGDASGETRPLEEFANVVQGTRGAVRCLQNRGEYMFVAEGRGGFRVYDIASIGNKGFSERIVTAPVSPLGQDTRVDSRNATCMALPTNQPIAPERAEAMAAMERPQPDGTTISLLEENQEQPFHPIYNYAVVTDAEEGLFLVDVNTLADGEPRNNFLRRERLAGGATAWNPDGVLNGARHITLAGHYAYITADAGLVVVSLDDPQNPRLVATRPLTDARASARRSSVTAGRASRSGVRSAGRRWRARRSSSAPRRTRSCRAATPSRPRAA